MTNAFTKQHNVESWLIGVDGAKKLTTLSEQIYSKVLTRANKENKSSFLQYTPWMDSLENNTDLLQMSMPNLLVISNSDDLEKIKGAVFVDDELPLGKINPEISFFHIDTNISNTTRQETFLKAISLVKKSHASFDERLTSLCKCIVPFYTSQEELRPGGAGFSTMKARGAIFLSCPPTNKYPEIELAINLSHELGHQALNTYLATDSILVSNHSEPIYSAIRLTERPAIRSLHAVVALVYMVEFLRYLLESKTLTTERAKYCQNRLSELELDLFLGIESIRGVKFTPLGRLLFNDCVRILEENKSFSQSGETIPHEIA